MDYKIEKKCNLINAYKREQNFYSKARIAFSELLGYLNIGEFDKILLPAYIGWSSIEGSGVFDPIAEKKIYPIFYHMGNNLKIDVADCKNKIMETKAKAILIIHYFGFPDENVKMIINIAKKEGLVVIEDAAHAFFSDRVSGICGNDGDYTLYSLHKMLPFSEGGVLVSNGKKLPCKIEEVYYDYSQYDLNVIAKKRVSNYKKMVNLLDEYNNPHIKILYHDIVEGVIPQTLPVVLIGTDRYKVYLEMNKLGWGVVSLYHTMIPQLKNIEYQEECWLSEHITNLPVHQDVEEKLIGEMINNFINVVNKHAN